MIRGIRRLIRQGLTDLTVRPLGHIPALDLLRTLAIVLVFSGHFASEFGASVPHPRFPLLYFGWTGVDLFFVLSGYLIGRQLWKELLKTNTIKAGTFLLRRGLRIWPLYFAFVLLLWMKALLFGLTTEGLWADATFLSNMHFVHQIGGGWSLSTEEQFYIILPVVLLLLSTRFTARNLRILPIVALIALPLIRFFLIRYSGMTALQVRDWMHNPIYTHSDGLATGVVLAWAAVFQPKFVNSVKSGMPAALALGLAGGVFYRLDPDVFNFTSLALIFSGLTLAGLCVGSRLAFLNWKGFYIASRLSYGTYLNHFGLLPFLVSYGKRWSIPFVPAYAGALLICMGFAAVTFVLIETPFLRLRDRWMERERIVQPQPVKAKAKTAQV